MEAIVTKDLCKVYKGLGKARVRSLNGLNLTIHEHEVFGYLGRNGAGKTTTIKILCGLLKASSGEGFVFGKSSRTRLGRENIGYLPEQPYFYEYLTPRETLEFYGKLRGLPAGERAREWDRLSEMLNLREIAEQRIKTFSKGMRQRIGFAVALIGNPPLLILDEPMSGLDPIGRRMIRKLILQQRDERKTIFFSSHVLGDVEQICDRVGILVGGRLTRQGRIDELTGSQVRQVEIIVSDLSREAAEKLIPSVEAHRRVEDLDYFTAGDTQSANAFIQEIHASGGTLIEFNPLRESLEDYFMREQESGSAAKAAL
jgi:ABC-2 type transport system ATP-binding protein